LAGAMASGTRLLNAEKPLLHAHRPAAVAGMASLRVRTRFGAAAMADIAGLPTGNPDFGVEAVGCLLKADVQGVLEIGAAIDLRASATPAPTGAAKDLAENIAKSVGKARAAHATAHTRIGIYPGMAEPVVRA